MAEANGVGWGKKLRRAIGQIGWVRLAITLVFIAAGLYLAHADWELPLAGDAERALYDLRFEATAKTLEQADNRIVLLVYNDDTLRDLGKRSPLDRHMLAQALRTLDAMQPRAIGIDILIDQAQPEDGELINTFRALRTPTYLAFATHAANQAQVADWQEGWMRGFFGSVGPHRLQPASIRVGPDLADGVVRRWTLPDPQLPVPLLANAMTPAHRGFADRLRPRRGPNPAALPGNPDRHAGAVGCRTSRGARGAPCRFRRPDSRPLRADRWRHQRS
jgi:adenylate cyclase